MYSFLPLSSFATNPCCAIFASCLLSINSSISLSISCDGQEEADRLWNAITKDGQEGQCGWCVDAYGVSWQVSPKQMGDYLNSPDPEVSAYALSQMRNMKRIVIADLHK